MKRPRSPWRIAGIAVLSLLAFVAAAGGVIVLLQPRLQGTSANAATSIPDANSVRVVATPLESGANKLRVDWTFLGGANWSKAAATGNEFALSDTYPLNDVGRRGGCNTYYASLDADAATGKWTLLLHGSDGTTVQSGGVLPAGKSVADTVQIVQAAPSAVVGTPAQITLARIDGAPVRISVAR